MSQKLCRECSYDLRAAPGDRCPECGRQFDPKDLWKWDRRDRIVAAIVLAAMALGACASGGFLLLEILGF